ncbi:hypothetical protein MASR2M17_17150 [Aminivibrio sp.]
MQRRVKESTPPPSLGDHQQRNGRLEEQAPYARDGDGKAMGTPIKRPPEEEPEGSASAQFLPHEGREIPGGRRRP